MGEHLASYTDFLTSFALKLITAQFINTALSTLFIDMYILEDGDGLWHSSGLAYDMFMNMCSSAIVTPFVNYFSIWYAIRLYKRKKIEKEMKLGCCYQTQNEANFWFEPQPFLLSYKYSFVIKTMFVMGFYCAVFPLLPLVGIVALCVGFWVEKTLILRRYARPSHLNEDLNDMMFEMLEYYPFALTIGNMLFKFSIIDVNYSTKLPDVLAIIFAALFFILPADFTNNCIGKQDDEVIMDHTWEQGCQVFDDNYDIVNPVTRRRTIQKLIQEQEEQIIKSQQQAGGQKEESAKVTGWMSKGKRQSAMKMMQIGGAPIKFSNFIAKRQSQEFQHPKLKKDYLQRNLIAQQGTQINNPLSQTPQNPMALGNLVQKEVNRHSGAPNNPLDNSDVPRDPMRESKN